ncbi:MAG: gamma-glutamyltransferase [Planctomycetes bacterium]|nr:gamma-glutamyltransferase [Planctomycetota bacterium]
MARSDVRALGLACALALAACRSSDHWDVEPRPATAVRGMVVSQHELATRVGVDVLERGGNAIDAAVATALALAVVYPVAGNLGGGGFAVVVTRDGATRALDFREVAPASANLAAYLGPDGVAVAERARRGPLSVGVPGSPLGLWELERELGSQHFSFAELAAPAIALAESGFAIDARLADDLKDDVLREGCFAERGIANAFYPGGRALAEGERLVQPELARTLERLASDGPDGFYRGEVAHHIVERVARDGAANAISLDDLASYRIQWRTPLRGWFRGYELVTMPPPSSGGLIVLQTLGVLDGFPLDSRREQVLAEQRAAPSPACDPLGLDDRLVHWWIEALRRAFAERAAHLGDPDFVDVPVDALVGAEWIARARVSIGENADPNVVSALPPEPESPQTTHLSVVDALGNAVSLTTTLNSAYGSRTWAAGFLLNNELDDFALPGAANQFGLVGSAANAIAPRKRPLSTMTPTIVRQGERGVVLVIGSPGGPRIVTSVIGVLLRVLVFGQPLADAVRAPRLHQQWNPIETDFEAGWSPSLLDGLERRGHRLRRGVEPWASVQAIQIGRDGEPVGVSDPRNPGAALAERARR